MSGLLYLLRGATLAFAWLLALNCAATIVVAWTARRIIAADRRRAPAFWLAIRLAPSAASLAFVLLLFVPSYWRYEPREFGETFDVTLTACAVGGCAVLAAAVVRAAAALSAASRRTRTWRPVSRTLPLDAIDVPVYAVDAAPPMMALAGIARPRLLVTRSVLEALTGEELRAGIAHELGHWRAWDNLKRLAMRAAPDLLFLTSAGRAIESRWASEAEYVADAHACGDARQRCALASALVKVARLTPPVTLIAEPISTLVDGGEIASRVECLLSDAEHEVGAVGRWPMVAGAAAAAATVAYLPLLQLVHEATEILVHSLP